MLKSVLKPKVVKDMGEVLLRQGTKSVSTSKHRWNLLLPIMIFLTLCILLCCIIVQIQMYVMFIKLQKEVQENSIMIAKHKGNLSSVNSTARYSIKTEHLLMNEITNHTDTYSHEHNDNKHSRNYRRDISSELLRFVPHHSRTKRDDQDARRRSQNGNHNRQQANRNNRHRHQGEVADPKVTTVLHLELEGVDDIPFAEGEQIRRWKLSDDAFNRDQDFATFANGQITVQKAGVYLIYSQVTFLDNSGRWSYSITIQESYRTEKPFIKCLSTEWGIVAGPDGSIATTFSQCYTAAVAFIKSGEIVRVKSMYDTDGIHTDHDMSFWGFVKLS